MSRFTQIPRRLTVAALLALAPSAKGSDVRAQFTDPCELACALTLGATSYVFATGTAAAVGRATGGLSTVRAGVLTWGAGFTAAAATGIALHGDGDRQRRAVYGSALGAVGGSLIGLALGSWVGESSGPTRLAATLVGAAVGVVVGGAVGALTGRGVADGVDPSLTVLAAPPPALPALVVRVGVGR